MLTDSPIEFIKLLKSQHRSIVSTVCEIDNQPGGPNDLKHSVEKLNAITDLLFDHLEKEDKYLYPALIGNKETSELAKKYSYDMERLSCVALDFFKRYCVNREGLKIFIEDFINSYSIFKGLLKVRIKREETELYPAFILFQSGAMHSEVLDFVKDQESVVNNKEKTVCIFGQDDHVKSALSLALEISGYKVISTHSPDQMISFEQKLTPDLVLIDITKVNNELNDLVQTLKSHPQPNLKIIGYSTMQAFPDEKINKNLDGFISKPAIDIEEFSKKIAQLLNH